MWTSGGIVRIGCALAALVLCGGAALGQDEGEGAKKKKGRKPKGISGVVRSVDLVEKRITVEIRKQGEKTFTCDEKSAITFTGPILDGIKAGDRIMVTLKPETENVILKAMIKRVGGGGGDQDKPAGQKKKRGKKKKKKKDEDPAEGGDGGGDGDLVM